MLSVDQLITHVLFSNSSRSGSLFVSAACASSVHEIVDEQDYNGSTQNDPPIGNLHARYRCFLVKPFHEFPPIIPYFRDHL
jgi:hypothetical protein